MLACCHFVVNTKLRSEEAFMGRCFFFAIYDSFVKLYYPKRSYSKLKTTLSNVFEHAPLRAQPSQISSGDFALQNCQTKIVHAVIP